MNMRAGLTVLLGWVAVPLTALGLIDPLEGGVALLAAVVIYVVIFALSRDRQPRLLWFGYVAAGGFGGTALAIAALADSRIDKQEPAGQVTNMFLSNPLLQALLVLYEIAVAIAVIGALRYALQLTRDMRAAAKASPTS